MVDDRPPRRTMSTRRAMTDGCTPASSALSSWLSSQVATQPRKTPVAVAAESFEEPHRRSTAPPRSDHPPSTNIGRITGARYLAYGVLTWESSR